MSSHRLRGLAALAPVLAVAIAVTLPAGPAEAGSFEPTAEIFATNNTAVITDPTDPRLRDQLWCFALQVNRMIWASGSLTLGSTLLAGVFWSDQSQTTTYEPSRDFHVEHISPAGLHDLAELIRKQYHQESVLTFRYLPPGDPHADSVEVQTTGVTVQQLHDGLVADPTVRDALGGGSVADGNRLILVAAATDLPMVRRFVTELGGDWSRAVVHTGTLEFVS